MEIRLTQTEENYLKAIYHLSSDGLESVTTTSLSESMETKPATVTDMIRKLSDKQVIHYERYKGVNISDLGKELALNIVRKHRLWEVFLVDKLQFNWDEVHEIAEQLEHINSPVLVDKLDAYLGHPKVDPHGDPIPDKDGKFQAGPTLSISNMEVDDTGIFVQVVDDNPALLQHLDKVGLRLGDKVVAVERVEFDGSVRIRKEDGKEIFFSSQIGELLSIRKIA